MTYIFKHATAHEAHDAMVKRLMLGDTHGVHWDWSHGFETGLHDVTIACDTFDFQYNLKKLWTHKARWNMMVRQYIDPLQLDTTLNLVADQLSPKRARGIAVMRTRTVQARMHGRRVSRRWGSCMLNMSFERNPHPTVRLYSRTSYFGYLAALDINVAHVFARECGKLTGIDPAEMRFIWNLQLAQFHGTRCAAWYLTRPKLKALMDELLPDRFDYSFKPVTGNQPGLRKSLDGYEKIVKADRAAILYGDEKYASSLRIRKRFHTEVMGLAYARQFEGSSGPAKPRSDSKARAFDPLPDLFTSDLDFSALPAAGDRQSCEACDGLGYVHDHEPYDEDEDGDDD